MYIDATKYTNSAYSSSSDKESSNELCAEDFLEILVAQLENQDPLNPTEDAEMLSELAQMYTLEEMTSMNENLTTMTSQLNLVLVNSAVSFIGQEVIAEGDTITVNDSDISEISYELDEDAASGTVSIYDEDGNIVQTVDLTELDGETDHTFQWDGYDDDGNYADDGTYTVSFTCYDSDGDLISVSTEATGIVTGITTDSGSTVFELADGRLVKMTDVVKVQSAGSSSENEEEES